MEKSNKKMLIASDHRGFELKQAIIDNLKGQEVMIEDLGCHSKESCDYPEYGKKLCEKVLAEKVTGILICGSGIGMSITANRYRGIRAALCFNEYMAKRTRMHNDANVLVLGSDITGKYLALEIVDVWISTEFEGGRHQKRIDMIDI